MTIISTTVGKNPLKEKVPVIVNKKSLKYGTWMQSQKRQMNSLQFQGKPFNITVIQVYALISNTEEA